MQGTRLGGYERLWTRLDENPPGAIPYGSSAPDGEFGLQPSLLLLLHGGIPLATSGAVLSRSPAFPTWSRPRPPRPTRGADRAQRTARFLRRTATTTPATAIAITTAVAPKNTGGSSPKIVTAGAGVGASSMSMSTALWNVNVM